MSVIVPFPMTALWPAPIPVSKGLLPSEIRKQLKLVHNAGFVLAEKPRDPTQR